MTEPSGASMIDRVVLDRIRALEGPDSRGLLKKVIGLYLSDSERLVERIRSAAETGDPEALRRAAHTLKSSSGNVGAARVSEICRRIEGEMAAGNLPSSGDPLLAGLEAAYRSAREELRAVLGEDREKADEKR